MNKQKFPSGITSVIVLAIAALVIVLGGLAYVSTQYANQQSDDAMVQNGDSKAMMDDASNQMTGDTSTDTMMNDDTVNSDGQMMEDTNTDTMMGDHSATDNAAPNAMMSGDAASGSDQMKTNGADAMMQNDATTK
ncbi:hypothetical protein COV04_01310 [Candidatus Uhrbacteria bacterium CG10_big_fil_rev_8_21_14_0_10_48_11]|uniref:Uncharacterized protein n=1 Tax=Candidatus Uhrbacteria bacterium CG10_big_fil_rev_8_21_14_0_10_48_11 TaxID=1975037 RepID=A0A2M8LFC6_9BACT|nr:MAG: hypothetical protein COV04_01310 [Candidatus Uhrbacteria bacterium CG10_big_fil_rev_8_21_14_0_10_48_11]